MNRSLAANCNEQWYAVHGRAPNAPQLTGMPFQLEPGEDPLQKLYALCKKKKGKGIRDTRRQFFVDTLADILKKQYDAET